MHPKQLWLLIQNLPSSISICFWANPSELRSMCIWYTKHVFIFLCSFVPIGLDVESQRSFELCNTSASRGSSLHCFQAPCYSLSFIPCGSILLYFTWWSSFVWVWFDFMSLGWSCYRSLSSCSLLLFDWPCATLHLTWSQLWFYLSNGSSLLLL